MQLKRRLYQLDLQDTDLTVYLHNPNLEHFDAYLQKVQGVQVLGAALSGLGDGKRVEITDQTKQDLSDIVVLVADVIENDERRAILREEVAQLTGWDCMAIVQAIGAMTQNALNPTIAAAPPNTPKATEQPT